jgi:tetratricopeptide (TPR) repeat protein
MNQVKTMSLNEATNRADLSNPVGLHNLGMTGFYLSTDESASLSFLEQSLRLDPYSSRAQESYALVLGSLGLQERAVTLVGELNFSAFQTYSLQSRVIEGYEKVGDITNEIKAITEALHLFRNKSDELRFKIEAACLKIGNCRAAVEVWNSILNRVPRLRKDYHFKRAINNALEELGDLDVTIDVYSILDSSHWDGAFCIGLGQAYRRKGDLYGGIIQLKNCLRRCQGRSQDSQLVRDIATMCESLPDVGRAVAALESLKDECTETFRYQPEAQPWVHSLARAYIRQGDLDKGIPLLITRLRYLPYDCQAQDELAEALCRKGDYTEAIALWKNLVSEFPSEDRLKKKLEQGVFTDLVVKDIERLEELQTPKDWGLRQHLARAYMSLPDEFAIQKLIRMIEMHPNESTAEKALAEVYCRQGNIESAITGWTTLVDRFPSEWGLRHQLSQVFAAYGNVKRTIVGWEKLVRRHPNEPGLQDQLAKALDEAPDRRTATQVWSNLSKQYRDVCSLAVRLAEAYGKINIDVEIQRLKYLIAAFGTRPKLVDKLRDAYERKGDLDEALQGWKDIQMSRPGSWRVQLELAKAYCKIGSLGDSVHALTQLMENAVDRSIWILHLDGFFDLLRVQSDKTIIRHLERLVSLFPLNRRVVATLLESCTLCNDVDWAIRCVTSVMYIATEHKSSCVNTLSALYDQEGNVDETIQRWKAVLSKDLDYAVAGKVFRELKKAYKTKGDINLEIAGWEELLQSRAIHGSVVPMLAEAYAQLSPEKLGLDRLHDLMLKYWLERDRIAPYLVYAYRKTDDIERCINGWKELLRADPTCEVFQRELAKAQMRRANIDADRVSADLVVAHGMEWNFPS